MRRLDFAPQFERKAKRDWLFIIALGILFITLVIIIKPDFGCFDLYAGQCV